MHNLGGHLKTWNYQTILVWKHRQGGSHCHKGALNWCAEQVLEGTWNMSWCESRYALLSRRYGNSTYSQHHNGVAKPSIPYSHYLIRTSQIFISGDSWKATCMRTIHNSLLYSNFQLIRKFVAYQKRVSQGDWQLYSMNSSVLSAQWWSFGTRPVKNTSFEQKTSNQCFFFNYCYISFQEMQSFSEFFVSVINYYHINGLHLFWDTLFIDYRYFFVLIYIITIFYINKPEYLKMSVITGEVAKRYIDPVNICINCNILLSAETKETA